MTEDEEDTVRLIVRSEIAEALRGILAGEPSLGAPVDPYRVGGSAQIVFRAIREQVGELEK